MAIRCPWSRRKSPNRPVSFKLATKTPERKVCHLGVAAAEQHVPLIF